MVLTLLFALEENQNIIYEHNDEFIELAPKHPIHQIHKVCWSIRQFKRHHFSPIEFIWCVKYSHRSAFFYNPQLMEYSC